VRQHPVRYPVLILLVRLLRRFLRSLIEFPALEQLRVLWTVLPPVFHSLLCPGAQPRLSIFKIDVEFVEFEAGAVPNQDVIVRVSKPYLQFATTAKPPLSPSFGCDLAVGTPGESEPQKKISKEGDRYLRTMMVQGAHYILGPFGEDSDLRRWRLKLAERGGKNAKKRAVVAWLESWQYCSIGCG
jgi:hypothetical protein